jgi:hypothetical protein
LQHRYHLDIFSPRAAAIENIYTRGGTKLAELREANKYISFPFPSFPLNFPFMHPSIEYFAKLDTPRVAIKNGLKIAKRGEF